MKDILNVYCDESCHLLSDDSNCMVLGSLFVLKDHVQSISEKIKGIKDKHGMNIHNELKWVKVSKNKQELYSDIINLFISSPELKYRCVVIPDKSTLDHDKFKRNHDKFYYVMYYQVLNFWIDASNAYNIYFDYKDINQQRELDELKKILQTKTKIQESALKLQTIQSYESQLMQMCDLITGAVSYTNRGLCGNEAKLSIANQLQESTKARFCETSPVRESKLNIFVWHASQGVE